MRVWRYMAVSACGVCTVEAQGVPRLLALGCRGFGVVASNQMHVRGFLGSDLGQTLVFGLSFYRIFVA